MTWLTKSGCAPRIAAGAKGRLPAKEALTLQMHIHTNVIIAMFRLTSAGRR